MELGRMRRLAACTLVVGALVPAAAGAASACDGGHTGNNDAQGASFTADRHADFGWGWKHQALAVASTYLGLSADTIVADLKAGQSLGQIADATAGHSSAGLVSAYVSALQVKLDAWVAAGKLTSSQEADILQKAQPWFQKLVDTTWTGEHSSHMWAFGHFHR
jgi:hypothetical protein